jgi:hypothetical protein
MKGLPVTMIVGQLAFLAAFAVIVLALAQRRLRQTMG